MVTLIAEWIIRIRQADEKHRRTIYGKVTSIVGICLNLFLFGAKNVVGILSGSIAIMADAFNNLSDAASSIITLMGFWLGSKSADKDHPFGHGRLEYLSGLCVAILVLLMCRLLLLVYHYCYNIFFEYKDWCFLACSVPATASDEYKPPSCIENHTGCFPEGNPRSALYRRRRYQA